MLQSPPSELHTQKAVLLAMVFVVGMYGWVIRSWLRGPESLQEQDENRARQDERRKKLVEGRRRPLWQKKIEAWWRLGNIKQARRG